MGGFPGKRRWDMSIELVHIGFGNILAMSRVIAIASPNSAPTKRIIHEGRNNGKVIDMTSGRRTKAVIFTDSGHIILGALAPETIASRLQAARTGAPTKQEPDEEDDEL
jgi:extracellular matrix regulatory protein A